MRFGKFGSPHLLALFHLSDESTVAVRFSPFYFLVLSIASFVAIICLPVLLGLQKLRYATVAGDCNSLVISVACHSSDRATDQQTTSEERSCSPQHPPLDRRASPGDEAEQPLKESYVGGQ